MKYLVLAAVAAMCAAKMVLPAHLRAAAMPANASLALSDDDSGTCGGNCPSGDCGSCPCGTSPNQQDIASWCSQYGWDQSCCTFTCECNHFDVILVCARMLAAPSAEDRILSHFRAVSGFYMQANASCSMRVAATPMPPTRTPMVPSTSASGRSTARTGPPAAAVSTTCATDSSLAHGWAASPIFFGLRMNWFCFHV